MAAISLDHQTFFYPSLVLAGEEPMGRARSLQNGWPPVIPPGDHNMLPSDLSITQSGSMESPMPDPIVISSDSDSDHDFLDEDLSDTPFPSLDELQTSRHDRSPDNSSGMSKSLDAVGSGDDGPKGQQTDAVTTDADSDGAGCEPLVFSQGDPAFAHEADEAVGALSDSGETREPSRAALSSCVQNPGVENLRSSSSSSSPQGPPSPSPALFQSDLPAGPSPTNSEGVFPRAGPTQSSDAAANRRAPGIPGPEPDEDVVSPSLPESSQEPQPPTHVARLDPEQQPEEWDKKYPFSFQAIRRRLKGRTQLSQQRPRSHRRSPISPVASGRRLSRSPSAAQQDELAAQLAAQESPQCEVRQSSPGDTTCDMASADASRVALLEARGAQVSTHRVSTPQPGDSIPRESMSYRAPRAGGVDRDEGDGAAPLRTEPKRGCAGASLRRRFPVDALDPAGARREAPRAVPRKRRRSGAMFRDDEEGYSPSQDSDEEQVAQSPRRNRQKSGPSKFPRTKTTRRQTSSNSRERFARPAHLAIPPSSQGCSEQSESVEKLSAKFTEWLSEAAVVRHATVDGVATFQLQFKTDLYCAQHRSVLRTDASHCDGSGSKLGHTLSVPLTPGQTLPVSQSNYDTHSPPSTEDEDWDVEEIQGARKRGRGYQVLVKWVGFKKPTWEPLKNFLGKDALKAYEAQHGDVVS